MLLECTVTSVDGSGHTHSVLDFQLPNAVLGDSDEWQTKIVVFTPVDTHSTLTCGIYGSKTHGDVGEVFMSQLAVYEYC